MIKKLFLVFVFTLYILHFTLLRLSAGPGTSGARILNQAIGARTVGMAEAFVAVADDANALYYNPAGITNVIGNEITSMYLKGMVDENYGFLGWAGTSSNLGSFGCGFLYYDGGKFEWNYLDGTSEGVKAQQDFVATVGYGREIIPNLSLGIGAKFLSSKLVEEYSGTAYAGDFGSLYHFITLPLSVGLVVQNIGTKLKYDEEGDALPMNIKFGVAYKKKLSETHFIIFAVDVVKPNDNDVRENAGVEYTFKKIIFVRCGYKIGYDLDGPTFGVGFNMKKFQLDYGICLVSTLDPTHRVSLSCRW